MRVMMMLHRFQMRLMRGNLPPQAVAFIASAIVAVPTAMSASVDGEAVYRATCSACHDSGAGAAPVTGRGEDWKERFLYGRAALQRAALEGVPSTAMAAKGGFDRLGAHEVAAAVDYMLGRTGFVEPAVVKPRLVSARPIVVSGDVPDPVVTARVAAALRSQMTSGKGPVDADGTDLIVRGVGIRVGTSAGTVRLMGVVQDAAVVRRAEAVVRAVDGVRGIDNRLVSGGMLDFD
jgi:cytochrome c5